jgi:hypothetical protein
MATIHYTSYIFHRPPLISEVQYNSIKKNLQHSPNYNPFPIESFFEKYKIPILIYVIGTPFAYFFTETGIDLFEIIGGLFLIIGMFALFSLVPEWISYLSFLAKRRIYYKRLLSNLRKSSDYFHFRDLML